MIAAMCANPCVDRTVTIDSFTYGGMNRITDICEDGSGKGVNVALASAALGVKAACIGVMPRDGSRPIFDRLAAAGCETDFVPCPGAVRVNTKVLDKSTNVVTELNEGGPEVSPEEIEALVETAVRWAGRCGYLVLTGSTPPGCPTDLYRTIIGEMKRNAPRCRAVLDAEGARLAEGLKALPFLVKPNRYELELLCGRTLSTVDDIHAEAQRLIGTGVGLVAVSVGGSGAYITDGRQALHAPALEVRIASTVGAGDAMVAGLLLGLESGRPLEGIFRCGMAAAASSVTTAGTGRIDTASFKDFIDRVEVRRVA